MSAGAGLLATGVILFIVGRPAGKRDEACALGADAEKLPHASEMLRGIAADACKQPGATKP